MQAQTSSMGGVDSHTAQMNQFKSYVTMLAEPDRKDKDVVKLKVTQEISKHFEVMLKFNLSILIKKILKIIQLKVDLEAKAHKRTCYKKCEK